MKIAVIGAGFSGLALAYHLAEYGDHEIVIFDGKGIGNGASGVAAGLLHPYAGAYSKKNQNADNAMAATERLLRAAEKALGKPVCKKTGLLRLASNEEQLENFKLCADAYPDVRWMNEMECRASVEGVANLPGIFIENGYVVDCRAYLDGLWLACEKLGVTFQQKSITSLHELDAFDHIVVAMGAASNSFSELSHLRVTPVKGQVLEIEWPQGSPSLPFPVSSQAYLLRGSDDSNAVGGATFEHYFSSIEPDMNGAIEEILPKLQAFYPSLQRSSVVGCRAGVRASAPGHRPLSARIGDQLWVLTGMGSKGLLYHALYSAELAKQIVSSAS